MDQFANKMGIASASAGSTTLSHNNDKTLISVGSAYT